MTEVSVQPYLVANDVGESLSFYRALGFETVRDETFPYRFAEVMDGDLWLLMSSLAQYGGKKAFGAFIVTVPDLRGRFLRYTNSLREALGRIPLAGLPRTTRLSTDGGQFRTFDPAGNMLVFMDRAYRPPQYVQPATPLDEALSHAAFNRDIYANDAAAAKILDRAIAKTARASDPVGRARLLGARAELAVAMGDADYIRENEAEMAELAAFAECEPFRREILVYRHLEAWMKRAP